ncbi:efflux RND transporter permease subunit [Saccharibacillus alkalitolerans]|uniref:Efflux RND transporter permease subunit n=1 Tax=Saccharibacillus alkalitolerans TaxID=2705290 RepID=A0ABX0F9F3_9BACL|nr:efflux RND transporter permease subunit [Saccharibacillus alkalitolerans]NGZ76188.1 efflux RND transporter permease subunit [Saccharibacillus alkalitolerans]
MKSIIGFSLRNKLAIWFLTIVVAAAGIYAGLTMKQETIPDINVPFLNITAVDPGAAPETVMNEVTIPLEQMLRNVDGVQNVTSSSMENAASVAVEFNFGANLDEATAQIREGLNRITLPEGVERPQITRFSLNSFPVISLSASSEEGGDDLEQLSRIAQEQVLPELEKIEGVASVQLSGQYVREVQLTFDADKMAEYGLTQDTVKNIVNASSVRAPLGLFTLDDSQSAVVVDGGVTTLEDLKALEIPVTPSQPQGRASEGAGQGAAGADAAAVPGAQGQDSAAGQGTQAPTAASGTEAQAPEAAAGAPGTAEAGGAAVDAAQEGAAQQGAAAAVPDSAGAAAAGLPTVKLSDIAKLEVVGSSESVSRTNGQESIGIQIVKTNDANTVDVVNAVKDSIADLESQYSGLNLTVMLDQGKPIEDSVRTMLEKAAFGALFAVLIILLFLRDFRSTIISILSIPLSLLIAVLLLKQMGVTLNMMTLGAMTVAIGRVVDDSIVVIENIYRRMTLDTEKLRGRQLISAATREMFLPIMSSTIVTLAVFVPLAFVSGMVGELFMPFALTMVFALLASLVIAVTLVPMLAHTLFRGGIKKKHSHDKPGRLAEGYKRILNWSLSHKLITFLIAVALLVGSLFTLPYVGTSFLPEQEDKTFTFTYAPEAGATDEQAQQRMLEAEQFVREQPHLTNMQYSIGGSSPLGFGASNSALFYTEFDSDTPNFDKVKEDLIAGLQERIPEGEWGQMDFGGGLGGSQLSVSVYGDSTDDLKPVADDILKLIQADSNFEEAESNLEEGYSQYTLVADQQTLSSYGLTAGQIAMALAPVTQRPVLTEVDLDGQSYNVYIETENKTFSALSDIEDTELPSPLGISVPVGDVVKVEKGIAPETITRSDGKTVAQLSANIVSSDVGGASTALENKINDLDLPDGITVEFGGVTEQINDTFSQLGLAMLAAIAIVYFVLVVTFGGGLAPFAILFSLPFIVIGALIGLLIGGESLSVSALMGVLMLIGIVVTNAIVLIDRVIHKEREGMSTREALLEAGSTRLRPILMTALATIGALIPLVAGWEGGAGIISKGLGITVIGGLISSTLLTLVIVPVVYEFLMKISSKSRARRAELEKLETPLD